MKITAQLKIAGLLLGVALALLLSACGGSGGGGGGTTSAAQGTLALSLTDSSTEDYRGIYVTVDEVEVQSSAGGWQTVATPGATYNLLELVNGVREELGVTQLDSGSYSQMRLLLGAVPDNGLNLLSRPHPFANYLIDASDAEHELKVPSGLQSGLKIVQGFTIADNQTTELVLDFDALQSVVKAGKSGKYLLKPTIKVLQLTDAVLLSGLVSDGSAGLEGALVSAQTYNNNLSVDAAERVQVVRSTISADDDLTSAADETGGYQLFLAAGNYNLVAYLAGYEPLCKTVNLVADTQQVEDFTLTSSLTGTVAGTVDIVSGTPAENQHVTIDFRQNGLCSDASIMVSVKTVLVENEGTYAVDLPVGRYQVVSSTAGFTTQIRTLTVNHNATIAHNPAF